MPNLLSGTTKFKRVQARQAEYDKALKKVETFASRKAAAEKIVAEYTDDELKRRQERLATAEANLEWMKNAPTDGTAPDPEVVAKYTASADEDVDDENDA